MAVTYPKLDAATLAILREQVEHHGSVAAVAAKLGYSRPAVSGALNGTYTGGVDRLRLRIVEIFVGAVFCPHLDQQLSAEDCRWWRTRSCPTSRPADVRHWAACKTCPINPERIAAPRLEEPTP